MVSKELDDDIMIDQYDPLIPSTTKSEMLIAEKAPAAIKTLKKLAGDDDISDIFEALGLTPHLER